MRQDTCLKEWQSRRVSNPTTRLLRLLTLLQSRGRWNGPELAERLEISPRTLRYDVAKLRELGYPVHAETGTGGGYALRPGDKMPPLLLGDDEAVALVVGLRLAASGTAGEAAATALVKLAQVMPLRLRGQVGVLREFTANAESDAAAIDPDVVVMLATACRDRELVRFDYAARDGGVSRREVEPYRLVQMGRRWYLTAFDVARNDWRSFRLDRLESGRPGGRRFTPRAAPDPAALLASTDALFRRFKASVLVQAPADVVRGRLPAVVAVEAVNDATCRVHATGASAFALATNLILLDQDFTVEETTADVAAALDTIGRRATHAAARWREQSGG